VIEREREAGSRGMALAQGCAGTVVWLGGSGRWDDKKTRVVWIRMRKEKKCNNEPELLILSKFICCVHIVV
jgi:hypothetical protein